MLSRICAFWSMWGSGAASIASLLSGGALGLGDCLYHFFDCEPLVGADQYMCEACGCKRDADRRVSIAALPEVLCVHLKRFSYAQWGGSKNGATVHFPVRGLDMAPFVSHGAFSQAQQLYVRAKEQQVGSSLSHLLSYAGGGPGAGGSAAAAAGGMARVPTLPANLQQLAAVAGSAVGGGTDGKRTDVADDNTPSGSASSTSIASRSRHNSVTSGSSSAGSGGSVVGATPGGSVVGATPGAVAVAIAGPAAASGGITAAAASGGGFGLGIELPKSGSARSLAGLAVGSAAGHGAGKAGRRVAHTMSPETRAWLLHRQALASGSTGVELVSAAAAAAAGTGLMQMSSPNAAAAMSALAAGPAGALRTASSGRAVSGDAVAGSTPPALSPSALFAAAAAAVAGSPWSGPNAGGSASSAASSAGASTPGASGAAGGAPATGPHPVPAGRRTGASTLGEAKYDLVSMVQHMGSLHGGHYISHGRNRQDGRWYTFNDADVSQTDASSVAAREGYLLFYVRRRGPGFAPAVLPPRASKEEDADHYVSMAWWLRYCMLSVPGPLSNADILCDHGSLKMQLGGETENLTIALTRRQYDVLATAYGASDPPLRDLSPCKECIVSAIGSFLGI
jgi:hypothetical protein